MADERSSIPPSPGTPPGIGFGVAQFAPGTDEAANLRQMRRLTALAVTRGAAVIVFPEYSSFCEVPLGPASLAAAQSLDGPFVRSLAHLARELSVFIVAGMIESTDDVARVANTLVAVDPRGAVVATYRKLHLYDAFGQRESDRVQAGDIESPQTFAVQGLTVGMQTCYDIRFPEVSRRLADAGANVILVPAEWMPGPLKEQHWRVLLTARALENTVYVVAADQAPPIGVGQSMIVDPMGVELVTLGDMADVAVAWLAPERVADVRHVNPSLSQRRFRVSPL
ncbi:carbon-nitrogen hydrolase family protein [Cryobacterium sp. CG_9.6]|uniref:carbon-nitrogen hydrolase family protein n=1 Tax=Cryobacterium sp. CG_9.6 TaxID=2760710 RepID=UPI0024742DB5|nr:carbon-nitrogen hydrolase family protein [Cryobacterium sp. CG_9.6]MDH6236196.1 putative amidohydrolase [Cryobacterium sp. CG_9.6]